MPRPRLAVALTLGALTLAACGGDAEEPTPDPDSGVATQGQTAPAPAATTTRSPAEGAGESAAPAAEGFPVTLEHAFGETVIPERPERVAAVGGWGNHETALALGVVPVGMPAMSWGDDDGDGVFPWAEDALAQLGAPTPTLFDETEGIDYEAVASTDPDVILAVYSGITEEDYAILSEIAPVVAYEDGPWRTTWQDTTRITGDALGLRPEADALVEDVEEHLSSLVAERPGLAGTSVIVNSPDPRDLATINFYTLHDPRAQLMLDLGLEMPQIVRDHTETTDAFAAEVSAERVDLFADVDVIMSYGTEDLLPALEADPLTAALPPVQQGSYAVMPDDTPVAAAINPSPLSLRADHTAELLDLLADAAANVP